MHGMLARPGQRTLQAGVTLIEVLVVMTILAFAAGIIVLNAPPSRSAVRLAAEDFASALDTVERRAALDGAAYRVAIRETGYRFERRTGAEWRPLETPVARAFDDGVFLRAERSGPLKSNALGLNGEREERETLAEKTDNDEAPPVHFVIDPIGAGGRLDVRFQRGSGLWTVSRDGDGVVTMVEGEGA